MQNLETLKELYERFVPTNNKTDFICDLWKDLSVDLDPDTREEVADILATYDNCLDENSLDAFIAGLRLAISIAIEIQLYKEFMEQ